jgi:hypothetical protein
MRNATVPVGPSRPSTHAVELSTRVWGLVVAFATNDILSSWFLVHFATNDILSSASLG